MYVIPLIPLLTKKSKKILISLAVRAPLISLLPKKLKKILMSLTVCALCRLDCHNYMTI